MAQNPNRVTVYMPEARRAKAQALAERLTEQGVKGLLDRAGKVQHSTLYAYLIEEKSNGRK